MMASGTVELGMSVAGILRRNTKITITTRQIVRTSVNSTSSTEARMVCVRSEMTPIFTDGGMAARMRGIAARMRSAVSMTLAPGCLSTPSRMVRPFASSAEASLPPAPPYAQAAILAFSGPSTAEPISFTRIGAPFRYATMTSFHAIGEKIWSLTYTATFCFLPSNDPFGALTVELISNGRTSSIANPARAIFAGSSCIRRAGFCWPYTPTWPTPEIWEICCATMLSA